MNGEFENNQNPTPVEPTTPDTKNVPEVEADNVETANVENTAETVASEDVAAENVAAEDVAAEDVAAEAANGGKKIPFKKFFNQIKNFKSQKKGTKIKICSIFAVIVLLIVGIFYLNTPKVLARHSISGTLNGLANREEYSPLFDVFKKGSISVEVSNDEAGYEGSGKIYFNKDAVMLEDLNVEFADAKISGNAYISKDYSYIQSDDLLGGDAYGIIKGEMLDAFQDFFFYDELDESLVEIAETIFEAYDNEKFDNLQKDFEKIFKKYSKTIVKLIEANAEYKKSSKSIRTGGDSVKARIISITIDDKAVQKIIEDLFEEVKGDDDLRDFIGTYGEIFLPLLSMYMGISSDEDILDLYDDFIDELDDGIDDFIDMIEFDDEIVIDLAMSKFTSKLYSVTISYGKEDILEIDFGKKGAKKSNNLSVSFKGEEIASYTIDENNSKEYSAVLEVGGRKILRIDVDRKADEYTIKVGPNGNIVVEGQLSKSWGTYTITVDKVKFDGETMENLPEISIVLKKKDKIKNQLDEGDVTNIFTIDEEDIDQLMEDIEEIGLDF